MDDGRERSEISVAERLQILEAENARLKNEVKELQRQNFLLEQAVESTNRGVFITAYNATTNEINSIEVNHQFYEIARALGFDIDNDNLEDCRNFYYNFIAPHFKTNHNNDTQPLNVNIDLQNSLGDVRTFRLSKFIQIKSETNEIVEVTKIEDISDILHPYEMLEAIFESFPETIIVLNSDFTVDTFIPREKDRANYDLSKIIGRNLLDAFDSVRDEVLEQLQKTAQTGETFANLIEFSSKFYNIISKRIGDHQSPKILLLSQDVTEVQNALKDKNKLDSLSEMVSIIAHDLRNPLGGLLLKLSFLRDRGETFSPDKIKQISSDSILMVQEINSLIQDLLQIGILNAEISQFKIEEVNPVYIVERILQDLKPENMNRIKILLDKDVTLLANANFIKGITENLVSNALKYSALDKPVDLSIVNNGKDIIIKVKDYGIGIPESEQSRIFDFLHRSSHSDKVSGIGIGLVSVRKYVEALKGTIEVQSEEGKGSTFTVRIPRNIES